MDFGRQPEPVLVTLEGEDTDVRYWMTQLRSRAEFKGDLTTGLAYNQFKIYPRAVND